MFCDRVGKVSMYRIVSLISGIGGASVIFSNTGRGVGVGVGTVSRTCGTGIVASDGAKYARVDVASPATEPYILDATVPMASIVALVP